MEDKFGVSAAAPVAVAAPAAEAAPEEVEKIHVFNIVLKDAGAKQNRCN
jgi:large subunit ribosomal protein L7/L12